ncbi:MAG TPA: lysophospholipid acyltransferase family protein [Candidatus Binataceae bacterium]
MPEAEPSANPQPAGDSRTATAAQFVESSVKPNGAASAAAPRAPREHQRAGVAMDWKSRVLFWLMTGVLHALSLLPDFMLYAIGIGAGWLGYRLDRRHVRIGMKNLAIAFPEKSEAEREKILRGSYLNLGRSVAEYIRLGGFFYRRLRRRVAYDRFWYLLDLQARCAPKGIVILTAHFGNFELLLGSHALLGHQISLVHHTQRFLAGDALMTFVRERAGVDVIRKHSAARAVLRALRQGDLVGIPFDQNAKRREAVFVPFFGEPAATASGVARMVAISGAPVMPVFIVRQPGGRSHIIELQDEVPIQRSADPDADLLENTRRFVSAVEAMVRRHPEQFLWTHRRYRTRPRGLPPVYDWETHRGRRSSDRADDDAELGSDGGTPAS